MAKKSASTPPSTPSQGFRGFINVNLTDDAKSFIKERPFSDETFANSLFQEIENGYKFTFSYDDYSHCYQCIGTRQQKEHVDFGILLSGRGSTPAKAFKQWLYIVREVIGENDWAAYQTAGNRFEIDD